MPRRRGDLLPGAEATMDWAEPPLASAVARAEAWRCLQCFDAPCTRACPAGIPIPRFIRMLRGGNARGAAEVVRDANPLAGSCGRACPDEMLCAAACTRAAVDRPIEIRRLHAYATDWEASRRPRIALGASDGSGRRGKARPRRVAVVGAGPAGIACAAELRRLGAQVVLFEAGNRPGGILADTIPLYRFPEGTAERDATLALGGRRGDAQVELRLRSTVVDVDALARDFDAVFVAPGLSEPPPEFPGETLRGVEPAELFLARCRARRYRESYGDLRAPVTAVIGGGNTAIDAAMAALRCGLLAGCEPRVHILYRRTKAEMPAWDREVRDAEARGVAVHPLVQPLEFVGARGRLTGVRLARVTLGAKGTDGRPRPVPVPESAFDFPCDRAILALGRGVDTEFASRLRRTRAGWLRTDTRGKCDAKIYAGGDATGGEQTIVAAVGDGKRAARAIAVDLGISAKEAIDG